MIHIRYGILSINNKQWRRGRKPPNNKREKMNIKQIEKEIVKAIKIEAEIPLQSAEGYKDLIKFVKKLFKEYREGQS
tara:strand:+ start:1461 stop:1691 length:231 start_codon:yes stop_codon:yes gene_type:complete